MKEFGVRYKYVCIKECEHWLGIKNKKGDIIDPLAYYTHPDKKCFKPELMTDKERFKLFLKESGLTYSDLSAITGNTKDSIKSVVNTNIPHWLKLAIWMHEQKIWQSPFLKI